MIPVATPVSMADYDRRLAGQIDVLIAAAGWHVARHALQLLGGSYGKRVTVVAGPGNNGADGRVAAQLLRRRGVRVEIVAPGASGQGPRPDLVIDAAFGTGLSRPYVPAAVDAEIPVLAVDIPSGLDGLVGAVHGSPTPADRTVTFVAAKPGLFFADGPRLAGEVLVAPLPVPYEPPPESVADLGAIERHDVAALWPLRAPSTHKWRHAVWIVGGSVGMEGAPRLAARGAQRAGAGYVRLSVPGVDSASAPLEAVTEPLSRIGWGDCVAADAGRFGAVVTGPGLGRGGDTAKEVQSLVRALVGTPTAVVIDADALVAVRGMRLGPNCVLTPHDGEFQAMTGSPVPSDRLGAAQDLASEFNAVVLLKGPTTVVAAPSGKARLITLGDARLATAGSGDVLAGVIAAVASYGLDVFDAAWLGASMHAKAGQRLGMVGATAADLAESVSLTASSVAADRSYTLPGEPLALRGYASYRSGC